MQSPVPEYSCQRSTPLKHHNSRFCVSSFNCLHVMVYYNWRFCVRNLRVMVYYNSRFCIRTCTCNGIIQLKLQCVYVIYMYCYMTLISKVNDFCFESTLYSFNYWFFLLLLSPLWVDKMLCIISTYIKILEYTWNIQELLNIPKDWTPLRLKLYIGLNKMCRTSLYEIYVPMKVKEQ